MRVHTASILLPASFDTCFDYLAEATNLPYWSVNFIHSLEVSEGGRHRVVTPFGEQLLELLPDRRTGVIDMAFESSGRRSLVPTRIIALDDACLYLFTLILPPQPKEAFESAKRGLDEELRLLERLITAC